MAGAQMTRREALAMVAAALGMTMISGCSPEWLDTTSELTERDLEVARNIGKTESDIEGMRKRGRASDDVRGAEAAEDYLAERYGEQFKAVGTETEYDSAVSPSRVVVTLAVVSGPAAGAECRAVYRLEDGPSWSDDYVSVRLDTQLRAIANEAFSEGFGDLSKGEAVWQSEVPGRSSTPMPQTVVRLTPTSASRIPASTSRPSSWCLPLRRRALPRKDSPSDWNVPHACSNGARRGISPCVSGDRARG